MSVAKEEKIVDVADANSNICRDYQRGVCNRGNKCKFGHPANIKPPDSDKPPICRDFQNGTCDRNNCKYLHMTSQEERIFVATGQLPQLTSGAPATPAVTRQVGPVDVCKDFLNNVCNRGSRCKFRHMTEAEWESEKRRSTVDEEMSRKRKRETFGGSSLDLQFLSDENDMLRRKIADLQRQVADLRAMNDTLYEQNMRYRSQLKSELGNGNARNGAPLTYTGYPRGRDEPVRYIRDAYDTATTSYPDREPGVAQSTGFSQSAYAKDPTLDAFSKF